MMCDRCAGTMIPVLGGDHACCTECGEIQEMMDLRFSSLPEQREYEEWSDAVELDFSQW